MIGDIKQGYYHHHHPHETASDEWQGRLLQNATNLKV
jgi:hypothetical protein